MKSKKLITLSLLTAFSLPAFSSVELVADTGMELYAINGQDANVDSSLFSSEQKATLPNGENQITFRYSFEFSKEDGYENVDTQVIIAKFNAADTTLKLNFPEYKNIEQAEENVKNVQWSLVDQKTGKAIPLTQDRLIKNGLQFGRNYVRETQDYNLTSGPAAIVTARTKAIAAQTAAAPAPVATATTAVAAAPKVSSSTAEEMLYFWYEKADAETRAKCKAYINQ